MENRDRLIEKSKQYELNNKEKIKLRRKIYREKNKLHIYEREKKYRKNHEKEIRKKQIEWRLKNKSYAKEKSKKWYEENKEYAIKRNNKWKENNKDKFKLSQKKNRLKKRYGMTLEEYDKILLSQKNKCAICHEILVKPDLDHDHKTKKHRGILCHNCNVMIGLAKDSTLILNNAIHYLKGFENENS
jgi:hypothetical protein